MKYSHTEKQQIINTIWDKYYYKLFSYINSKLPDNIFADDLLQDIFLKIYINLEGLKDFDKLESWIFKITQNRLTDYYRRKNFESLDIARFKFQDTEEEAPKVDFEIKKDKVVTGLKAMIADLPAKYATALLRVELEGEKQVNFANELGISVSGAKSRVQRGRKKLKEALEDCCNFQYDKYGNILDYQPRNIQNSKY